MCFNCHAMDRADDTTQRLTSGLKFYRLLLLYFSVTLFCVFGFHQNNQNRNKIGYHLL